MQTKIELPALLKELHNISGFRLSIYDTSLHEIAAYPQNLSGFCSLLQQNPDVKKICIQNDTDAFDIVKKSEEIYIYRCNFGLYEAVAPLYHFGVLSGYLMMGQTLDTKEDSRAYVLEKALIYIKNRNLLEEEINRIPTRTREQILSCISIMNVCAEYISLSNRFNSTDKNLAHKIKKYLNSNFALRITLDSLSNHFFYSKPTIVNAFKKAYGKSINEFLLETRLTHAVHLLTGTTDSIRHISEQCGFSDQNYFSKVFIREYGITPSQYRLQYNTNPINID